MINRVFGFKDRISATEYYHNDSLVFEDLSRDLYEPPLTSFLDKPRQAQLKRTCR